MFFGTSAKTYFLSAVDAGCATANATSNAAAPARYAFMWFPPCCSGTPSPAQLLEQHREHDEHTDERALPVRIHARHQQRIADHLDQRRTDEGTVGAALAAHQVGAADHGGSDHPQLVAGAESVDRGTLPADDQHR